MLQITAWHSYLCDVIIITNQKFSLSQTETGFIVTVHLYYSKMAEVTFTLYLKIGQEMMRRVGEQDQEMSQAGHILILPA